jgi:hypothetical protein
MRETNDGVFAHTFLVLTWNLGCRVNNTVNIQFKDIVWSHHFDCFQVHFSHSTTDPMGDDRAYPRHIFANPIDPIVCPVLLIGMYFSSCFSGRKYRGHVVSRIQTGVTIRKNSSLYSFGKFSRGQCTWIFYKSTWYSLNQKGSLFIFNFDVR